MTVGKTTDCSERRAQGWRKVLSIAIKVHTSRGSTPFPPTNLYTKKTIGMGTPTDTISYVVDVSAIRYIDELEQTALVAIQEDELLAGIIQPLHTADVIDALIDKGHCETMLKAIAAEDSDLVTNSIEDYEHEWALQEKGYFVAKKEPTNYAEDLTADTFRLMLCDCFRVGNYTTKEQIIQLVAEKLQ